MNTPSIAIMLSVLGLGLLWCCKSRITLQIAIWNERRQKGELYMRSIRLADGEMDKIGSFMDSLDCGWAGHIYLKRISLFKYRAIVEQFLCRSGPADGEALYVNGRKVRADKDVTISEGDEVILRTQFCEPQIQYLHLSFA